jgi:pimeloyl-ACP methyl ester carboxylesterase
MTSTKKIRNINGISEIQYLTINNTQQYVLIRGENVNNPILLFLHGGPGASETAMLRKFNKDLEKHFTIVYWDQRNTGKSYKKNFTKEEIKVRKYNQDVDALVSYLKNKFNRKKIFLVGHSWGSRLGMYAIQRSPDNFTAYVGVGQELSSYEGELISYHYTLNKARELNKVKAIKELEEMGKPQSGDYSKMYKNGYQDFEKQKKWLIKLGGDSYGKPIYFKWMLSTWFSREYSFFDFIKCIKSIGFVSKSILHDQDYNSIDFFKQFPEVKIPVFFISGKYDYNVPWQLVEKYCDTLKASLKEFIKFEKSGHNPAFEEAEKFNKEIIRIYNLVKS